MLGAVAASAIWLAYVLATATTPNEADRRRAAPDLPPPVVKVVEQELRQVTWYPCGPAAAVIPVPAPSVPSGQRPLVTSIAKAGAGVRTGTKLASVGDRRIFAVVTPGILYRDLLLGDTGPDVAAFRTALLKAGLTSRSGRTLDEEALAAWRDRVDPTSPVDRVRVSTLLTLPQRGSVRSVSAVLGDSVEVGAPLLEVGARTDSYVCEVPDPGGEITPASVTLEADGQELEVGSVQVHDRTPEAPGTVEVVPAQRTSATSARLAIETVSSDGVVLTVPLSALKTLPSGAVAVAVVDGKEQRNVKVEVGVSAQGWVEVKGEGLSDGVTVELFDAAAPSHDQPQAAP